MFTTATPVAHELSIARSAVIPPKLRLDAASLILQHYDIVGAKAHHPALRYTAIAKADPAAAAYLEANAPLRYSQARVDTLDTDETFRLDGARAFSGWLTKVAFGGVPKFTATLQADMATTLGRIKAAVEQ